MSAWKNFICEGGGNRDISLMGQINLVCKVLIKNGVKGIRLIESDLGLLDKYGVKGIRLIDRHNVENIY